MPRLTRALALHSLSAAASVSLLFQTCPTRADDGSDVPPASLPERPPQPVEAAPLEPAPEAPSLPDAAAPVPPSSGGFPITPAAPAPQATVDRAPAARTASSLPAPLTASPAPLTASPAPLTASPAPLTASASPAQTSPIVAAPEPERRDSNDSDGIFGPIRLGPLIGIGLPNLLNFGGTLKLTRFFGAGINVGIIPTARISYYGEATLSYQEYDIYGRIYPFGGGFFLGAGAGYEQVRGTLEGNVDLSGYSLGQLPIPPGLLPPGYVLPASIDYTARGSVRTLVLTPQLGYLHTFRSGFSVGVDIGAQIPIAPSQVEFESTVSPKEVTELEPFQQKQREVRETLEKVGRTPLPTFNFRIGWLL
jgi:hypothetical protein